MTKHSRREFMGLSGAGIGGLAGAAWSPRPAIAQISPQVSPQVSPTQGADLVVINAKVYTVDAIEPRAQAFAVNGGRFVAVGSTADVRSLVGRRTQVIDAGQLTVVPGFIDAHNHAPG